jgi:hypothetical protein
MKKLERHLNFKNGVLCAIAFMVVCIVISICLADKMRTNTASIIGGALSAIATVFLGLIAIWQNTRYKKMADEANDLQVRPEFFVVYRYSTDKDYYNIPTLTVYPKRCEWIKDARDDILCFCKVLNFPVIRIEPQLLFYYKDGEMADVYSEFDSQMEDNLILEKDAVFRIILKNKDELDKIFIEVEFENIFGSKYRKTIEFIPPAEWEMPEASIFGKFESGKVRLYPAEKVK